MTRPLALVALVALVPPVVACWYLTLALTAALGVAYHEAQP